MKRFSLRALLVFITVMCVWLGWRFTNQRLRQRDVCRELVSATLVSLHVVAFEPDPENQMQMSKLLASFDYRRPYVTDFILPDGALKSGAAIDDYELELLETVAKTKPSNSPSTFYERQSLGTYRYYQPIWSGKNCSICHPPAGGLIAVTSVKVDP